MASAVALCDSAGVTPSGRGVVVVGEEVGVARCEHGTRCSRGRVAREPVTAVEGILCVCFADALGVCRVGADDDFFALGGDARRAAGMVTRVQRQVGLPLRLTWLDEHRTPERLAKALRRHLDRDLAAG